LVHNPRRPTRVIGPRDLVPPRGRYVRREGEVSVQQFVDHPAAVALHKGEADLVEAPLFGSAVLTMFAKFVSQTTPVLVAIPE
jgi:hypothetical protein